MDKPVSKRRRSDRSITPDKSKIRKKVAFEIKKPVTRFSVHKKFHERSESPDFVLSTKKAHELRSQKAILETAEPEVPKNQHRRRQKRTPERDTGKEKRYEVGTEQLKVSLPIDLFDNSPVHRTYERNFSYYRSVSNRRETLKMIELGELKKNATENEDKPSKKEDKKVSINYRSKKDTKPDSKNMINIDTFETHNPNCKCNACDYIRAEEEDDADPSIPPRMKNCTRIYKRVFLDVLNAGDCKESISNLQTIIGDTFKVIESVMSTMETTQNKMDEKINNIDKILSKMNENHDKNWESVSETLAAILKHLIDNSKNESTDKHNDEVVRILESPTTTSDISYKDDILQKAEQFSEQNKAIFAKEKAQKERNERTRTMDSQTQTKNQPFAKVAPNGMLQQNQINQKTHDQHSKQQLVQNESQTAWQHDLQHGRGAIELKEQHVRQQIANFYQQQQNTRLEIQKAFLFEQEMARRDERTAIQEYQQTNKNLADELELIINNEQLALQQQQQQLVEQHEQLMARHNEKVALNQAQLLANQQTQFAKQQETNLANESTLRNGLILQDSANTTPANNMTEQRVLRPRPTPQVVLQHTFVEPKQKAPRKLTAKQVRERRATVQCDPKPSATFYPHVSSMRLPAPAPLQEDHPVQRNVRLAEENFQQQVPLPQVYVANAPTALQNQEFHQQHVIKAAKLRARRASCQPSLSYLDQGLCHEMLRRRLINEQVPSNHETSNYYPQQLRYFSNTPQPGNTNVNYSQCTQTVRKEIATSDNGLNLSTNHVEQTSQNFSQESVPWMAGRSTSITRIPKNIT